MQVGQKKPQTNANVNPPAFRKLFEDEDNALVSETSPQFKKIWCICFEYLLNIIYYSV